MEKNEIEQFAHDLNTFINEILIKARKEKKSLTKEKLVAQIDSFLHPPTKGITLFEYIEKFIKDSESGKRLFDGAKINHRTIQRYKTTKHFYLILPKHTSIK